MYIITAHGRRTLIGLGLKIAVRSIGTTDCDAVHQRLREVHVNQTQYSDSESRRVVCLKPATRDAILRRDESSRIAQIAKSTAQSVATTFLFT